MIKKIKKFLYILFSSLLWNAIYISAVYYAMSYFWSFNIFELRYWKIIYTFWEQGGVIDTASEYFFFVAILCILPFWVWGWKKSLKISYIKLLLFPIIWYINYKRSRYKQEPSDIIIKNIGSGVKKKVSPQQMMADMIAQRMPKPTDKKDLNSNKIRSNFEDKTRSFHKKADSGGDNK